MNVFLNVLGYALNCAIFAHIAQDIAGIKLDAGIYERVGRHGFLKISNITQTLKLILYSNWRIELDEFNYYVF